MAISIGANLNDGAGHRAAHAEAETRVAALEGQANDVTARTSIAAGNLTWNGVTAPGQANFQYARSGDIGFITAYFDWPSGFTITGSPVLTLPNSFPSAAYADLILRIRDFSGNENFQQIGLASVSGRVVWLWPPKPVSSTNEVEFWQVSKPTARVDMRISGAFPLV